MAKDDKARFAGEDRHGGGRRQADGMISDTDVWRAAHLTIQLHGDHAEDHAGRKALERHGEGDQDGMALWLRIRSAVQALQRMAPTETEGVH